MAIATQDIITVPIKLWLGRGIILREEVKPGTLLLSQLPTSLLAAMMFEEHASKIKSLLGCIPNPFSGFSEPVF